MFWLILCPTDGTQDMMATIDHERQYYPSICYSEEERPYLFTGTKVGRVIQLWVDKL